MDDYNTAPSDEIFEEIKERAIEIWETYDDRYGYATEKINQVKSINNYKDNWGTIVGMFDYQNQQRLLKMLSPEAKKKVGQWL